MQSDSDDAFPFASTLNFLLGCLFQLISSFCGALGDTCIRKYYLDRSLENESTSSVEDGEAASFFSSGNAPSPSLYRPSLQLLAAYDSFPSMKSENNDYTDYDFSHVLVRSPSAIGLEEFCWQAMRCSSEELFLNNNNNKEKTEKTSAMKNSNSIANVPHVDENICLKSITPALPSTADSGIAEESGEDAPSFSPPPGEVDRREVEQKTFSWLPFEIEQFFSRGNHRLPYFARKQKRRKSFSSFFRTNSCGEFQRFTLFRPSKSLLSTSPSSSASSTSSKKRIGLTKTVNKNKKTNKVNTFSLTTKTTTLLLNAVEHSAASLHAPSFCPVARSTAKKSVVKESQLLITENVASPAQNSPFSRVTLPLVSKNERSQNAKYILPASSVSQGGEGMIQSTNNYSSNNNRGVCTTELASDGWIKEIITHPEMAGEDFDSVAPQALLLNATVSYPRYWPRCFCCNINSMRFRSLNGYCNIWSRIYYHEHFTWYFGISLSACFCPLTNVVAISLLPANVVGFAGLQIFFALLLAKFWLKKDVSYWNFFGFALLCSALMLVALSAGDGFVVQSLENFFHHLVSPLALSYIITMFFFIILCSFFYYEHAGGLYGRIYTKIRRFALPATIGLFASFASLGAKAITMAVENIILEKPKSFLDVIKHWRAFVVIGWTVTFALFELLFLNRSLQICSAVAVISIMTSILTLCGGIGGMLIFEDYPDNFGLWFFGLFLALLSLFVLSYGEDIARHLRSHGRLVYFAARGRFA